MFKMFIVGVIVVGNQEVNRRSEHLSLLHNQINKKRL
jgi:hypothetical protein